VRRRRTVAVGGLAGLGLAIGLLAAPGGTHPIQRPVRLAGTRQSQVPVQSPTSTVPTPGSLPQTNAFPSANTPLFKQLIGDLWTGVIENRLSPALPAFFPLEAYAQLKAIGDAAGDWHNRLVYDYRLDIGAAHALLGSDAAGARLLRVTVMRSYGHWVPPGVCYNSVGYYEMPNARVVYRAHGQVRSFGIASLISWRGVWYVVHFGAILRSADVGEVDDPASGPGVSTYSGTC
jgi:hypothetical protein